jgi:hypothetical protein
VGVFNGDHLPPSLIEKLNRNNRLTGADVAKEVALYLMEDVQNPREIEFEIDFHDGLPAERVTAEVEILFEVRITK